MEITLEIKDRKELSELTWLLFAGVCYTEQSAIKGGFSKAQKLRSARLQRKLMKQLKKQIRPWIQKS